MCSIYGLESKAALASHTMSENGILQYNGVATPLKPTTRQYAQHSAIFLKVVFGMSVFIL